MLQIIRRDESTGAPTLLFRVHVDRGISWEMAQSLLNTALTPPPSHAAPAGTVVRKAARAGQQQPGQVPVAPSSGPEGSGQVPAAPSQSLGDPAKPIQKLRIRFGGALVTGDVSKPGSHTQKHKPTSPHVPSLMTKSNLPASAPTSGVTDEGAASASFSPSAGADAGGTAAVADALVTHVSSVQELLQLHDMESQTRMNSLDAAAAAAAEPTHTHDSFVQQEQPSPSKGQYTSSAAKHVAAPTAVVTSAHSCAPPPASGTPQQIPEHISTATCGVDVDLHHGLGDGRATGAVVGGTEPGPAPCVSGYYQPRRGAVRGLLLALEAQGKGQVAVYRPATGPAARPIRIDELAEK